MMKRTWPISGQRKAAATPHSSHATHLPKQRTRATKPTLQPQEVENKPAHGELGSPVNGFGNILINDLIAPPAKSTRALTGGSSPIAAGESLLQRSAISVVNILLMLCGGPILPRGVRRKPNLKTTQTSPISNSIGLWANLCAKSLAQTSWHSCAQKSLHIVYMSAHCKVCDGRTQTVLFVPTFTGWLSTLPKSTSSFVNASCPRIEDTKIRRHHLQRPTASSGSSIPML